MVVKTWPGERLVGGDGGFEGGGEGVEGEGTEEVAAEAGVDLVEGVGGAFDPVEG